MSEKNNDEIKFTKERIERLTKSAEPFFRVSEVDDINEILNEDEDLDD